MNRAKHKDELPVDNGKPGTSTKEPPVQSQAAEPDAVFSPVPTYDLTARINDAGGVSGDDRVIDVTADGFVTGGGIAGADVVDFGLSSDAGVGGLGVDLDDLPGDETPIRSDRDTP